MLRFGNIFLFKKAFTPTRCEEFIHEQIVKPMQQSMVYGGKDDLNIDHRNSEQCKIMPENPFCRDVARFVRMVNDDFLNINVFEYCSENSFIRYNEGGRFNRHKDVLWQADTVNHISRPIRKISAICLLSERETFEGGKFVTYDNTKPFNAQRTSYDFDVGDLIIFPSYVEHQVEEITQGIRYSTVHWSHGGF